MVVRNYSDVSEGTVVFVKEYSGACESIVVFMRECMCFCGVQ